jgi:hypothetical protein
MTRSAAAELDNSGFQISQQILIILKTSSNGEDFSFLVWMKPSLFEVEQLSNTIDFE